MVNIWPKVSIIILNWNGLKDTIECLESLKKITYPNYEVIVVDNGSKGNDVNVLEKKYKDYIRLIKNKENLGFAEGNNVAIRQVLREGKSDYILLLNNDTVVAPNFLTELVKASQLHDNVAISQAKILLTKARGIHSTGNICDIYGAVICRGNREKDKEYEKVDSNFFYPAGACMLIKKKALEEIGLFDKELFAYNEDLDLGWRARLLNYQILYVPKSICFHKETVTLRGSFRLYYFIWRNRIRVLLKNYSLKNLVKRLPIAIFLEILSSLGYSFKKRRLFYVLAVLLGIIWNIKNLKDTFIKRKYIQSSRKVSDQSIEKYMLSYSLEWARIREL